MKKILFLLSLIFITVSCNNTSSKRAASENVLISEPVEETGYSDDWSIGNTEVDQDVQEETTISTTGRLNGYEWVDLGLSVLWATRNVGACRANESGGLYAWGETKTKSRYEADNYFDYSNGQGGGLAKIEPDSGHDTAREKWGCSWRMPSFEEFDELNRYCSWKWSSENGYDGYLVTGPNGNSIFLPVKKYGGGQYWSNSLAAGSNNCASCLTLTGFSHTVANEFSRNRESGSFVRPVSDKDIVFYRSMSEDVGYYEYEEEFDSTILNVTGTLNGHDFVDLGLSVKWATCNVGANYPDDHGGYFAWGDTQPKDGYYWSNCFDCVNPNQVWDIGGWGIYNKRDKKIITPDSGHDTARENWGDSWRMPTEEEFEELLTKCTWEWKLVNDSYGNVVTGPNGNAIFLPAAGYVDGKMEYYEVCSSGSYWTSALFPSESYLACIIAFGELDHEPYTSYRRLGRSIRPVTE